MDFNKEINVEKCLWCKRGKINYENQKIFCNVDEKFHDKNDTCNKWRYCC